MDGISAYSTDAEVILGGSKILASSSRRESGTLVTPVRTAVEPMRVSWCTPVRIVNSEVLPVMGNPIMAVFIFSLNRLQSVGFKGEHPPGSRSVPGYGRPSPNGAGTVWHGRSALRDGRTPAPPVA